MKLESRLSGQNPHPKVMQIIRYRDDSENLFVEQVAFVPVWIWTWGFKSVFRTLRGALKFIFESPVAFLDDHCQNE